MVRRCVARFWVAPWLLSALVLFTVKAVATPMCIDSTFCTDSFDDPGLTWEESSTDIPGWQTTGNVKRYSAESTGGTGVPGPHMVLTGVASARWLTQFTVDALPQPPDVPMGANVVNYYNWQFDFMLMPETIGRLAWYAGDEVIREFLLRPLESFGGMLDDTFLFVGLGFGYDVGCVGLDTSNCGTLDPSDPRIGKPISLLYEISAGEIRIDNPFVFHQFTIPVTGTPALFFIGLMIMTVNLERRRWAAISA